MSVFPALFLFVLLSWSAQQAECQCERPDDERMRDPTEQAQMCKVQPSGKKEADCQEVECDARKSVRPDGWTGWEFDHAYKRCKGEFGLDMGAIRC